MSSYTEIALRTWHLRWPHFKPEEFMCKHCKQLPEVLDTQLLDNLEALRKTLGKPLKVNSGHRCRQHNLLVGGATYSQHKNLAVDLSLQGHDLITIYRAALSHGFLGIGLGDSFIHLDMRREIDGHQPKRKLTIWYYSKKGKERWTSLLASSDQSSVS